MIIIRKNDRLARILIIAFSIIVFIAVTALERVTLDVNLGFDPHIFALINAIINSIVSLLLLAGLYTAKTRQISVHRNIMLTAISLSVVFLITYILHHLFAGSTWYGDIDHNGKVDDFEKTEAGMMRYVYFFLLGTHILLAGISLPFILFTAYRALIGEYSLHRKIARSTKTMA